MASDKNDHNWVIRAFVSGAVKAATFHIFVTYVIPFGLPLLAGYLLRIQGIAWGYVVTGAALTFGGVATGLVNLDEWIDRRRIDGKLDFSGIRVGVKSGTNEFRLGVLLHNRAARQIDCEILEWHTRLSNRVPSQQKFTVTHISIPPGGDGWFDDNFIDVGVMPRPGAIDGLLEFKLRYGPARAPKKYDLRLKKQVSLAFDANGTLLPGTWHDAA